MKTQGAPAYHRFLPIAVCGWMNQQQQLQLIGYLREENRVLREQLGQTRLRFNDDQSNRLPAKAKGLGSKLLRKVATIVAPETLLAWYYYPKDYLRISQTFDRDT